LIMDLFFPIQAADNFLGAILPPFGRVILWPGLAAAISMGIYAVTSPQEKLKEVVNKSHEMMTRLSAHEGDFNELLALTKDNLRLAGSRIIHTIPATIISVIPVLYILVWMETAFETTAFFHSGPSWARGWIIPALASLITVSLIIKKAFRIE